MNHILHKKLINILFIIRFLYIYIIFNLKIDILYKVILLIAGDAIDSIIIDIYENKKGIFYKLIKQNDNYSISNETYNYYEKGDKILDIITNIFIIKLLYDLKIPKNQFLIILFLFIYRLIGIILFFKTNSNKYFIYFINYFEFYVIIYLISKKLKFTYSTTHILYIISFILKIIQEVYLHSK